jgi:hypothetical protein
VVTARARARGLRTGASRLGCLIQIAILAAIAYVGVDVGQDALSYYRVRDAMKQEARFAAHRTDVQIQNNLRAFADSVKLPAAAKEFQIVRDDSSIRIWTEYDQELKLPFNQTRSVHLRPSVEKTF